MPLLGNGAMVFWNDVVPADEADFNAWHSHEHLAERVGIPGFRRGHRFVAIEGQPKYFIMYEVDDLTTLISPPYLERLEQPTPWTKRAMTYFRNNNRTLCRVAASHGLGTGSTVLTIQFSPEPGQGDRLRSWLVDTALPGLAEAPGLVGAHLLLGDDTASQIQTEEKRRRATADEVADWVILVSGYDVDAVHDLRATKLSAGPLCDQGARSVQNAGIYRLLHTVTEADLN